MAKEIWNEITDEERNIILKHIREQYESTCELCGENSEEAGEAKAVYKKVISESLQGCWGEIENFYSEMLDAVRIGMNPDNDMAKMILKVLGISNVSAKEELDMMVAAEEKRLGLGSKEFMGRHVEIMDMCEATQKSDGGLDDMKDGIKNSARKANYERGMKHGSKVYCGQDLKELIGLRVTDVTSDDNDMDVIMWFEDGDKDISVYFDNMCFDGDSMSMVERNCGNWECMLRPVSEEDLKEINGMVRYCDNEVVGKDDVTIGINHMYCNNIGLEDTEQFKVKSLYVFYDGRIMTEERV